MCGSGIVQDADTAGNGKFIQRLPGWGHHNYAITAHNDSARFYFNQGLTMYYSYHMAGQTGNARVKIQNLEVVKVFAEQNLLVVKGSIPGAKGSFVIVDK